MRDPKLNPSVGDIVRSTRHLDCERHVFKREGSEIYYVTVAAKKTSELRSCWITTWQKWCAKNKVEIVQEGE